MRHSILEGLSESTLQARLEAMQQGYLALVSGEKGASFSYTQGDGSKSVTYTQANIADLTQAILTVQSQLDRLRGLCINRRAPLSPRF